MPGQWSKTMMRGGYGDPKKLGCGGPKKSAKKYACGGKMKKSKKK